MKRIKHIFCGSLGVALLLLAGCIKETIYTIPTVDLRVVFDPDALAKGASRADDSAFDIYLYPNFDYTADPIIVHSDIDNLQVPLLPGDYGVLLHNSNIAPLYAAGDESFETLNVTFPDVNTADLISCPRLYALNKDDKMRRITVARDATNAFVFNPVVVSRVVKFVVNTEKFGNITSARAELNGVASSLNLSSLKSEASAILPIGNVAIDKSTLVVGSVSLLGFTDDELILTLFFTNDEVDFELEQPIDLTDKKDEITGGDEDIDVEIDVTFSPDIRIFPVRIYTWDQDGNKVEIGIK